MNHPGIMGILNESSHPANIKHSHCIVPNVCNFLTKPWFIRGVYNIRGKGIVQFNCEKTNVNHDAIPMKHNSQATF